MHGFTGVVIFGLGQEKLGQVDFLDEPDVVLRHLDWECCLPVNLIQAFFEISGHTSLKETADA